MTTKEAIKWAGSIPTEDFGKCLGAILFRFFANFGEFEAEAMILRLVEPLRMKSKGELIAAFDKEFSS